MGIYEECHWSVEVFKETNAAENWMPGLQCNWLHWMDQLLWMDVEARGSKMCVLGGISGEVVGAISTNDLYLVNCWQVCTSVWFMGMEALQGSVWSELPIKKEPLDLPPKPVRGVVHQEIQWHIAKKVAWPYWCHQCCRSKPWLRCPPLNSGVKFEWPNQRVNAAKATYLSTSEWVIMWRKKYFLRKI